jgi:flagellar assembly protein FliH
VSRIIRSEDLDRKSIVRTPNPGDSGSLFVQDQVGKIEQESFQRGYLEGERAGRKLGDELLETATRRYDGRAAEMAQAYRELIGGLQQTTIRLALDVARKILRREFQANPGDLEALVAEAIATIAPQTEITLRVSQPDFGRVHEAISAANPAVTVKEDRSLEAGDFIIDTPLSHLDGRLDSQIESLRRNMIEAE